MILSSLVLRLFDESTLCFAAALVATAVGLLSGLRARRNVADWSFVVGIYLLALDRFFAGLSLLSDTAGAVERWQQWRLTIVSVAPGVWLVFSLTYARLNAPGFLRSWRWLWPAALVVPGAIAVAEFGELFRVHSAPDERWVLVLSGPAKLLYLLILPLSILVLANLERTYRAAVGTQRWRIKFMLLGVGVLFLSQLYTASQALLYGALGSSLETTRSLAMLVALAVIGRQLLRTAKFEAEVYPSQSVLQGSIIILLAAGYLVLVGLIAKLATLFGGTSAFALKALVLLVAMVLLVVLAQSDRIRLHLRRWISRHFQRPFYDYQTVWRKFSEGTAEMTDTTALCRNTVKLSADVFQALSATIWLAGEDGDRLQVVASTSLSPEKIAATRPEPAEVALVLAHFSAHPAPVDIELAQTPWAEALRRWQPSEFPDRGGHRICAPFARQGRVIGLIIIGDRIGGLSFPEQDMDMLGCVADHLTTRLLNVQFAQRLVQSKELEAFQTMATFFVHDLKNAAFTLNLMLQNLPRHFNDPAFREDALRGMGKTVDHMNRLIGRLGQLRHDLKLSLMPTDFSALVARCAEPLAANAPQTFSSDLPALPAAAADSEQLQKVVTNLILNAIEATPPDGEIRLRTFAQGPHVILEVADTGCGMSPEFLSRQLFRPFQTTKKTGLGIGMFQSKMIVEAHGGRLTVASAPGRGATFQVLIPLHGK